MKKYALLIAEGLILFLFSSPTIAQEMKKTSRVLEDSKYIHAVEVTLEPGEKTDIHTHPAHFFYALSEGKLKVHYKDGKEESFDLKPGASGTSDPERPHITENVGTTTVKFLLVELKEHPYVEHKSKK